jgi:hypothetical protein
MNNRVIVLLTDPELVTECVADKAVVTGVQTYDIGSHRIRTLG